MKLINIFLLILILSKVCFTRVANHRIRRQDEVPGQLSIGWYKLLKAVLGQMVGAGNSGFDLKLCGYNWTMDKLEIDYIESTLAAEPDGNFSNIVKIFDPNIPLVCSNRKILKGFISSTKKSKFRHLLETKLRKRSSNYLEKNSNHKGELKQADLAQNASKTIAYNWKNLFELIKSLFESHIGILTGLILPCIVEKNSNILSPLTIISQKLIPKLLLIRNGIINTDVNDILFDMICNWEDFKTAITYLINAKNDEDTVKRWKHFGKFLGKMLYIMVN